MSAGQPPEIIIEIFGEGSTDVGGITDEPTVATSGVVPILTRKLCGDPDNLRVRPQRYMFLSRKKDRWQKVRFVKRQARINGSQGCVFIVDTEGDRKSVLADLLKGRDFESPEFPMAVGVAHPCIEAWMLADASAVKQGLGIDGRRPVVPTDPESIPMYDQNGNKNLKNILKDLHPRGKHPNLVEKSAIAEFLNLDTAASVCPSFAAFATEVQERIAPLFPALESEQPSP